MPEARIKYKLNDKQRDFLRSKRESLHLAAETVSKENLNKSKGWLAQLERGRFASIKESDLVLLLSILYDVTTKEVITNDILNDFLNISGKYDIKSWYNDSIWDCWIDFEDKNLDKEIKKELSKFISNIESVAEITDTQKMKFIIWQTLQNMNINCSYSFLLFSLINNVKLQGLDGLTQKHRAIEINNLFELFKKYNEYDYNKGLQSLIDNTIQKALQEEISCITVCSNLLIQLMANPSNKKLVDDYNSCIQEINTLSQQYNFSDKYLSTISNYDTLVRDIANILTPELLELRSSLQKKEEAITKSIDMELEHEFSRYTEEMSFNIDSLTEKQ